MCLFCSTILLKTDTGSLLHIQKNWPTNPGIMMTVGRSSDGTVLDSFKTQSSATSPPSNNVSISLQNWKHSTQKLQTLHTEHNLMHKHLIQTTKTRTPSHSHKLLQWPVGKDWPTVMVEWWGRNQQLIRCTGRSWTIAIRYCTLHKFSLFALVQLVCFGLGL